MKYLVTGGCGFFGSNLAAELLAKRAEVFVLDNLSRPGAVANLAWLRSLGSFTFLHCDVRNADDITLAVRGAQPDAVFHLAGQVAMTTSLAKPRLDFEINALGTLNVLESLRIHSPETILVYSSTNKVYGDLEHLNYEETETRYRCVEFPSGFDDTLSLDFHSPYGCSKGCADQYVLDYTRLFGIRGVVFRHSSIYGGRQFPTIDQGWIGWFCSQALRRKYSPDVPAFTIAGNGKQVRDVLHVSDAVRSYIAAVEHIDRVRGHAINLGGGIENSLSLLELFYMLDRLLDVRLSFVQTAARVSDQRFFVADNEKATRLMGWGPSVSADAGIQSMLHWLADDTGNHT